MPDGQLSKAGTKTLHIIIIIINKNYINIEVIMCNNIHK